MSHINTISEFLLQAGTDYRVFDMARGIRSLESQLFLEIENATRPAPCPRQQHAWFGILFFNKQMSNERYIWFVKLPLDEQGLVIGAARQQFLQIVVDALGQSLEKPNNTNNQLPDNPFTFIPNQQQLADFNSIARVALNIPLSHHVNLAEQYITTPEQHDWRAVSLQGIADFTASLQQSARKNLLLNRFLTLAPEMQYALCASLENHSIGEDISTLLVTWYQQDIEDEKRLHSVLRGLCQSQAKAAVHTLLTLILNSEKGLSRSTLMLIAARHWQYMTEPAILTLYVELLAICEDDTFIGLFSDLVQIPEIRESMLSILRWPEKSPQLTQAVGQLFGQNTP
ncbi:DUF3549 family protein [uncultured Paraglaciecola sp.]|uniref:DUF3549 family protein n=1 Tax=uncultured Paraglaciecola sp. TaxID=1765024 RepID=UPI0030DDDA11|tara:strand:- start:166297 stop:167322 length:1026 start_codon:yes stop_codon:yes gene_type:complete